MNTSVKIPGDRRTEWFVPRWGPLKFRIFVGLLFLPYTGMVLSFTVIGGMLAETIHWDRVVALIVIYFLGLGVAAHALDALGSSRVKPWGEYFSRSQLWALAAVSLIIAYTIAIYYMVRYVPLLWVFAILEGFFVFAYNLEWFKGRFHTDGWFAFSWGMLPLLAGYVMQTNDISLPALILSMSAAFLSYVEINASRPYKELKRITPELGGNLGDRSTEYILRYERILKSISFGVILLGLGLMIFRAVG